MLLRTKLLVIYLISVLLFISCGIMDSEKKFVLTNPTEQTIQVKIDDKDYSLEPEGAVNLNLSQGVHSMVLANAETVKFRVNSSSTGGVINPTRSPLVIFTMIYAVSDEASNSFMPPTTNVIINGVDYKGPIQTTDAMFVDNNIFRCDYYVGEAFPEEITLHGKDAKGNLASKYFTQKEFVKFFATEFGQDFSEYSGETQITSTVSNELPTVNFEQKEMQDQALKVIEVLKAYQAADNSSDQEKLYKEYNKEIVALVKADRAESVEENIKYSNFVSQAGAIIGMGIGQISE